MKSTKIMDKDFVFTIDSFQIALEMILPPECIDTYQKTMEMAKENNVDSLDSLISFINELNRKMKENLDRDE